MIKRFISSALIVSILLTLTACYDSREIDDMAYVMAIGVDKGKNHELRLTLQFVSPKSGGGDGGEGGSSQGIVYTTVEAPTIYSGLNMANGYVSKQINMSHAKLIVFSKELAEEGIYEYMNAFIRGREFRGSMYLAISRTSAEEFIRASNPLLQASPARLFEGLFKTYQYTAFSSDSQLFYVYNRQQSESSQAVASLVGVGKYKDINEVDLAKSTYKDKGDEHVMSGDYKAGDLPKVFDTKAEVMGLAVFEGGKMIGELDGEQSWLYLVVTGKYKSSYISIPEPKDPTKYVVLNMKQSRIPVKKVDISGEKPKIDINIKLEGDITSIQSGYNYENPDFTPELENFCEVYIKEMLVKFLYKTSKEYKSDICGFGQFVKSKFLTWQEWEKYDWLKKYSDSEFNVTVDLKIRRPGLIVKTVPAKSSEGESVN